MSADPIEILLIEDNKHDIFLTREALREAKIKNTLHVATDGEEGLEFLRREGDFAEAPRPDLILLDLNLPILSGRELLAIIKEDESLRTIPVVVLTTSEANEDIVDSYNLHANCYISRPVSLEEFAKVVRSIEGFWFSVVKLPVDSKTDGPGI